MCVCGGGGGEVGVGGQLNCWGMSERIKEKAFA